MSAENASSSSGKHSVRLHHQPSRKRRYIIATLLLLLAMGAGVVIGAGATIMYIERMRPRPPRPKEVGDSILKAMSDSLGLTVDETAKLRVLVDEHMGKIDGIRKKSWDDIRDQFDSMQDDVVELVGPDRYAIWEKERNERLGVRKNLEDGRKRQHGYDPSRWRERREGSGHGMGPGDGPGMHHD